MSANPRRESLSLFDLLNPVSKPSTPAHTPSVHHPPENIELDTTAQTQDINPITEPPAVVVKTEPSNHTELDDEDQELLALGATEEDDVVGEQDLKAERATSAAASDQQNVDRDTVHAIALAQNEYGTRVRDSKKVADRTESSPSETPKPTASKKRPAPKASMANLKASSDVKKPLPKKRKVEHGSDRGTPSSLRQSPTPSLASARLGKPAGKGARKNSTSATPRNSSPAVASSPRGASEAGSDDDGIYCICRKGDNHQWMVACDGGCDDWYHGKCVDVQKEDENLIDKYICPICTEKTQAVTTWKPMCRREGCRNPAQLKRGAESKYCSGECGVLFMQVQLRRLPGQKQQPVPASRGTRGRADTTSEIPSASIETDVPESGSLGGPIRARELKALALAAPDVDAFRNLGSGSLLTPPPEPSDSPKLVAAPKAEESTPPNHDDAALHRLEAIAKRKAELRQRRLLLKDRERFINLAKDRTGRVAATMKVKDMCGYDTRLAWDEASFAEWRESPEGQYAFSAGTLDPDSDGANGMPPEVNGADTAGLKPRPQPMRTMTSESIINGDSTGSGDLCTKRRCQRHPGWQKLVLHDIRFEEAELGDEMRTIDAEEREIKVNTAEIARRKAMAMNDGELGSVEVVMYDEEQADEAMMVNAREPLEGAVGNAEQAPVVMASA